MKEITLTPKVNGKSLDEIDMGKGEADTLFPGDWVFYKSGYILIGTRAVYDYNLRITRKREEVK